MSRAYRIRVSESATRVVHAEDHVSSKLELLGILPVDQMADLLAQELVKEGFERDGDQAVRTQDATTVTIDLQSGTVEVRAEGEQQVKVSGTKDGYSYDDIGPSKKSAEKALKKELQKELDASITDEQSKLQRQVTDALESKLNDLRGELDGAINRTTAEALKQKASQLGQIKEVTEDPQAGSLTIVVEV